jgi:HAE1 family hydrophobic/amphiphilic exporter-1
MIFGLGLLLVYLTLAGQYESLTLPFIILLSVPIAILGALAAQWGRGLINDVYCQIGLVMLIGLSAKNGILVVEFAEQLRARGLSIADAAVEAARIRLRPILMTSLAFILGVMPLVLASGAGREARHSVGTAVAGGMLASTFLNLAFIPVLYVVVKSIGRKRQPKGPALPERCAVRAGRARSAGSGRGGGVRANRPDARHPRHVQGSDRPGHRKESDCRGGGERDSGRRGFESARRVPTR